MAKELEVFTNELWDLFKGAAKNLLDEEHVKAKARDLIEYAARAQHFIHTVNDPAARDLAQREFKHRTAHIEGELAGLALEATKASRLTGLFEGVFNLLLKYGPALL